MRSGRTSPMTPSMAVAVAALAVALGGTAMAAAGGTFANDDDGLVQACVAQQDIVNSITDPVVGAVGALTANQVGSITSAVTPKGTVLVVAPGQDCPAHTAPQRLSSAPQAQFVSAHSTKRVNLGPSKIEFMQIMLPAGESLVTATVDIVQKQALATDNTIKCVLVDNDNKTISNTESSLTIPAGADNVRDTLPLNTVVTLTKPGHVGTACKGSADATKTAGEKLRGHTPRFFPGLPDMGGTMSGGGSGGDDTGSANPFPFPE